MSAPSCIAFVGLRFPVSEGEIEALEERSDPRVVEAIRVGLSTYWGNFGVENPQYVLFVGTQLGSFGLEGKPSLSLSMAEIDGVAERTRERLASTTMAGDVSLHIQHHPD